MKYIKWIFAVMFVALLLYLVLGQVFLETDVPDNGYYCEEFNENWIQIKADGSRSPVTIPGKCQAERDEEITVETKLPETIDAKAVLCFRSAKQDMEIYVDGVLREEYSTKATRLFGKTSAVAYVFLELMPEDAGKTLTLVTRTDSSYSGIFYTVYYGSRMGIWHHFFELYGAELIVAFLTLVLGVVSIIGSIALRLCYHRKIELEYLGWGVTLAALWLITNSVFRQIIFPNISIINDVTFLVIMILPLPFMIYMNAIQKERYRKLYECMGVIVVLDFVICSMLHMMRWKDFADTIYCMAVVCVLCILAMGITILIDLWNGCIREYVLVALGILGAIGAAFVQIVMYFQRTSLFTGVTLALGLICLLVFSVINTVREILYMEREKQQALSASEAKGRFLANMSHEIRTPINAVLGMDAIILRESKESRIREYAMDIQNAGQSLLALINDILDISKIESGKMELVPVEYDFSSLVHDIVNMISMKAEAKELAVELEVEESLPSRLWGDDVRIRQVLINLLNNAVKYTEEGKVTLTIGGEVHENKVLLQFAVEDTGIGIREEDLSKLFAEFERIEESRNRNVEGTGLGMSITTQLLGMMGSRLQVESEYGKGSRFYFKLEQRIVDGEPVGNLEERIRKQAREYSHTVEFTAPDANVLLVDDNAVNRKVFVNLLRPTEVKIDEAASGGECLEMIQKKRYDLIFLDHMMPDMDGVETLEQIRGNREEYFQSVPVVVLTANAIAGAREMYLSQGFDSYLSKPINPDKLEKMLMEWLPDEKLHYEDRNQRKAEPRTLENLEAEFPVVEGVDWEYAMMHVKNAEMLRQTLADFYDMTDSEAETLEGFFRQLEVDSGKEEIGVDLRQYRIQVHGMKSSAAMIGALPLSGLARVLEYAARDEKEDVIRNVTLVFLEEWRGMKERLAGFAKNQEKRELSKEKKPDYWMVRELLDLLEEAVQEMDIDTADDIVKELNTYLFPERLVPMMRKLSTAVTNIDVHQVTEWAETIKLEIQKLEGSE